MNKLQSEKAETSDLAKVLRCPATTMHQGIIGEVACSVGGGASVGGGMSVGGGGISLGGV